MIHEWRVLSKSPDESAWIMWIDDDSDAEDHIFRWGEDSVSEHSETVTDPDPLKPLSYAHIYSIQIDGLEPGTEYVCEIDGESETVEQTFRTLTDEPFNNGLSVGQISDIHPWRGDNYMYNVDPDAEIIGHYGELDIDLLLINGDFPTTRHDCVGSSEAETVLDYFETYHHALNEEQIVPLMMAIGNHEWGYQYDPFTEEPEPGVECDDDIAYYFETLFPNVVEYSEGYEFDEEENAGYDYNYEITIGGELQILALDAVTIKPWDTADRAETMIRDDVQSVIPLNHYGMWCTRSHDQMEPNAYANRSYLLPVFDDYPVRFAFTGHDHGRGITYPFRYSEEEPDGGDYEELDDGGYAVIDWHWEESDSIVEFASGWATNRGGDSDTDWAFQQLSGSDYENHYFIEIENSTISVEEIDPTLTTRNTVSSSEIGGPVQSVSKRVWDVEKEEWVTAS